MLAVDDEGKNFELSPDPLNAELTKQLEGIKFDNPGTFTNQLRPILSNVNIFGVDLYEAGIGDKIENIFREMINGKGSVRAALKKYLA